MRRFVSALLVVAVFIITVGSIYFITAQDFPEGCIYNYLEYNNSANILVNLDDYLAVRNNNSIIIYDKKSLTPYTLSDSVFDIEKNSLFLLNSVGNTLYYICTDSMTGGMVCYSFNVDTYEKSKIHTYKGVTNSNGFLGIESIFGIQLVSNNTFNMLMNSGNYWLNNSGIHSYTDREELLKKYDKNNEYGIFDGINKLAETDDLIFFVNYFGELVRFDKKTKEFSVNINKLVSEFFITENKIYYIAMDKSSVLYSCDYNGDDEKLIGNITCECVKFSGENIYVSDSETIYKIADGELKRVSAESILNWAIDKKNIYVYNPNTNEVSTIQIIKS